VILADDAGEFRDWLRSLLEESSQYTVVGEAQTGSEAVRLAGSLKPDLVITDVDMPDGDGLEVVRILREQLPELQVIVVSANTGKGYERMAREEGAAGFIPKSQLSVEALSQLVRREGSR
jgi:two-component system response regulator DesR